MQLKNLLYILFLLITVSSALSIEQTDLMAYYSFEETTNATTLNDQVASYDLTLQRTNSCNETIDSVSGFFGNSLNISDIVEVKRECFYNGSLASDNTFSVNLWFKMDNFSSLTLNDYPLRITNTSGSYFSINIYKSSANLGYNLYQNTNSINFNSNVEGNALNNTWYMMTLVYDGSTFYVYHDGAFKFQQAYTMGNLNTIQIGGYERVIVDEVSVFSKALINSEVSELYNSGSGYIFSFNGTSNFTYPIYYDYCQLDNVLCHRYNTTSQTCLDSNPTFCFDGCEHYPLGFGGYYYGYCVNNTAVTPGASVSYLDICLGNQLCSNYTITNLSGSCSGLTYCITGCSDNTSYYYENGGSPANNNFTGRCSLCSNECNTLNATQCSNIYEVEQCRLTSNGCYRWIPYLTCATNLGYYCSAGECLRNTTSLNNTVPIGTTTDDDTELWNNFLYMDASTSTGRLLIAILVIIVCSILSAGLIFSVSNASGATLPGFITIPIVAIMVLIPFFYFIAIGFIPFWIFLLLIIIIGLILASIYTKAVFGGG